MRIKAILLGVSLAVAAFAADDKYSIPAEGFRIGEEIKLDVMTAIGEPGQKVRSIAPANLDASKFYMRRKVDGTVYGIYEGKIFPEPYRKFFAFDLSSNKISMKEAMKLKFYGTRRAKPYRDEPELYFDEHRVYSPHTPVLFFQKNGEWESLTAVPAPGILSLVSVNPDVRVIHNGKKIQLPVEIFPVDAGIYYTEVSSPDYFTYVDAVNVAPNKITTLRVRPTRDLGTKVSFFPRVHENEIASAESLEALEALYDVFRRDSLTVVDTMSGGNFNQIYPEKKTFENVKPEAYEAYSKAYDSLYAVSLKQWSYNRLSPVNEMSNVFVSRFEEFYGKEHRFAVTPVGLKVFRHTDSSAAPTIVKDSTGAEVAVPVQPVVVMDSINLVVKDSSGRVDFSWTGYAKDVALAPIVNALATGAGVQIFVRLENNKPAWFYAADTVAKRMQYRYIALEFVMSDKVIPGVGHFVLPERLLKHPEVYAWLHPVKDVPKPVVAKTDTVKKDTVKADSLVTNPIWGEVVKVDSASFRYHGKVVGISGFYIQAKEVSQQQYRNGIVAVSLIKHKDRSTYEGGDRPVHNITWNMAREYCQAIGGDLPTEAQWEFAARAGGNDGFVWDALGGSVEEYAIYDGNAGKDQKGPQNVGSKKPNAWGIYDMAGNVAEWTRDSYSWFSFYDEDVNPTGAILGYTKVFKGGSYNSSVKELNATRRNDEDPRYWSEEIGFRCMFPLSAAKPAETAPAATPENSKTAEAK